MNAIKNYIINIKEEAVKEEKSQKTSKSKELIITIPVVNETDIVFRKETPTVITELVFILSKRLYYIKTTKKKDNSEEIKYLNIDNCSKTISLFFKTKKGREDFFNENKKNIPLWLQEIIKNFKIFLIKFDENDICHMYSKMYAKYINETDPSIKNCLETILRLKQLDSYSDDSYELLIVDLIKLENELKGILDLIYKHFPTLFKNISNIKRNIPGIKRMFYGLDISHIRFFIEVLGEVGVQYVETHSCTGVMDLLNNNKNRTFVAPCEFNIKDICDKYSLDIRRFIKYLIYDFKKQGLCLFGISSYQSEVDTYRDYLAMSQKIYGKVKDKYPNDLLKAHRLITIKNNIVSCFNNEKVILEIATKYEELTSIDLKKEYSFLLPKTPGEFVSEGVDLNHCVASYVSKVIDGECIIVFMRKSNELEDSLITIEINNDKVMQIRGQSNRSATAKEMNAIKDWAKIKNLKII